MIGETSIVPPIAAFVAAGFEHCIANMYFIPMGLFLKEDSAWLEERGNLPDLANLTGQTSSSATSFPSRSAT